MNIRERWSCLLRFLSITEEIPGMCRLNFLLEEADTRTPIKATGGRQNSWTRRVLSGSLRPKFLASYSNFLNNDRKNGPKFARILQHTESGLANTLWWRQVEYV